MVRPGRFPPPCRLQKYIEHIYTMYLRHSHLLDTVNASNTSTQYRNIDTVNVSKPSFGPGRLPLPRHLRIEYITQGPSWGYLRSQISRDLVDFDDKCPQNGSKNDPMAPRTTLKGPHEGASVVHSITGDTCTANTCTR